jgi:hypothetical protein
MENCNKESSSGAHQKSLKIGRGSYLDIEIAIVVKIFELYPVTHSI